MPMARNVTPNANAQPEWLMCMASSPFFNSARGKPPVGSMLHRGPPPLNWTLDRCVGARDLLRGRLRPVRPHISDREARLQDVGIGGSRLARLRHASFCCCVFGAEPAGIRNTAGEQCGLAAAL